MEGEEGKGGGEGGLNIYPSYYLQTGGGPTIIETIFFVFFLKSLTISEVDGKWKRALT